MRVVRELLRETKAKPKKADYFQIDISDGDALSVFGARAVDLYSGEVVDDDYQVVFLRVVNPFHAQRLKELGVDMEFDFDLYDYFLLASSDA